MCPTSPTVLSGGGGYLSGRSPLEETLCRQTFLYLTLERNDMYSINAADKNNIFVFDTMIYSPDVFVIWDDKYDLLNEKAFKVNVISSPAADNRKKNYNYNPETIMERRIRKIVMVAAYKKNNILILGAFVCAHRREVRWNVRYYLFPYIQKWQKCCNF